MDERLRRMLSRNVTEDTLAKVELIKALLDDLNHQYAQKLHISDKEFQDIISSKKTVSRIVYSQRKPFSNFARYGLEFCIILVFTVCLSASGLADNLRSSFLSIFQRPVAVDVMALKYTDESSLQNRFLPSVLPAGFDYVTHAITSSGALYVLYADALGNEIQYYCYPQNAIAAHDNERASHSQIPYRGGLAYADKSDSGTILYLLMSDGSYVQLEFDGPVSDGELAAIANGLTTTRS